MYGYEGYEIVSIDSDLDQISIRLYFNDEDTQATEIHTISPLSRFNLEDQEALDNQVHDYASAYINGLLIEESNDLISENRSLSLGEARDQIEQSGQLQFKDAETLDVPADPITDDTGAPALISTPIEDIPSIIDAPIDISPPIKINPLDSIK